MYLRSASLPLLLLLVPFQIQGDLFRRHYEAAEAQHRAGNFAGGGSRVQDHTGRGVSQAW